VDTEDGTPPSIDQLLVSVARPAGDEEKAPYWEEWPEHYDYVYVLFSERGDPNPAPERLRLIHEGRRFQLYRIVPPEPPAEPPPKDQPEDEEAPSVEHPSSAPEAAPG
jgi:hypothetical protein